MVTETKRIPKTTIKLLYNNKDCTADWSEYISSVSYKDYEDEQSDELSININNNDGYFTDLWYPAKGDKLTCSIGFDGDIFTAGAFTIDDNNFDFSPSGDTLEVKALAASVNNPVRTAKIKNWSGKNLVQIANEIGKPYGFKVVGNSGLINVGNIVQKNENDMSFLRRVSKLYGYTFNIKDNLLTFTKTSDLEALNSLFKLSKSDLKGLQIKDTITKVYGKCKVQYLDLKTNTIKSYTATGSSGSKDTLNINKRCGTLEEAKAVAEAAIKNGGHEVIGRVEIAAVTNEIHNLFIAGVNFDLTGVGRFEGKYHIKTAERRIDKSGYTIGGEIVRC